MGDPQTPRRPGAPLLGALLLGVAAAIAAGVVALHGKPVAQRPPAPTPTPAAAVSTPSPTPQGAAPVGDGTTAAWDSTHQVLVTYTPDDAVAGSVHTWANGSWFTTPAATGSPNAPGILVDAPPLRGVVLVSGRAGPLTRGPSTNAWLWSGSNWLQLPPAGFQQCLAPSSGAWDRGNGQLVVVVADQCQQPGVNAVLPSETWTFDGRAWTRRGPVPDGVTWPALAWDAGAGKVAMLQGGTEGDHAAREWWWTGSAWQPAGSMLGAPSPVQFAGAAWDGSAGGVIAIPDNQGLSVGLVVRRGSWSILNTAQEYPQHVAAVAADTSNGRILVLGQQLVVPGSRPDPTATAFYLLTWNGLTWVRLP